MSAPATKVRPAPVRMIASTLASSRAAMTHSMMPCAHAMAQRIHGRIVDGDDGDVAVATQADWIVHERLSLEIFIIYSRLQIVRAWRFAQIKFRNAERRSAR